jgi:hypothetical protein
MQGMRVCMLALARTTWKYSCAEDWEIKLPTFLLAVQLQMCDGCTQFKYVEHFKIL